MPVLNIAAYEFATVDEPKALAAQLRQSALDLGLLGTILVAPEGLNLFLAATDSALEAFILQVCRDSRFANLQVKRSRSEHVPFRRLKVRVEREIITFDPDITPDAFPTPSVAPETLKSWLDQGHDDAGRPVVLLDTRNEEEIALGTFSGAINPHIRKFTELPGALPRFASRLSDSTIVAFCTGGVRCEKAVPWLHQQGFKNCMQLDGGILGYFEAQGGAHWQGHCFVFDERVALAPDLSPMVDAPAQGRV